MLRAGTFRRAAITTLGSKINTYEFVVIVQKLQKDQWTVVSSKDLADLYVINSCTVTSEAGRQTRQEIRRAISRNPSAFVVVTGCYAEMEEAACAAIPGVDLVVGNSEKLSLVEHLRAYSGTVKKSVTDESHGDSLETKEILTSFPKRIRAFIQIQQGCDQGCTYRVIHQARGKSQSFALEDVEKQVQVLLYRGYKEIVLCGIDLGSWSKDFNVHLGSQAWNIVRLLEKLSNISGNYRLRLSSIDPTHISNDLLDMMACNEHICPHLHISMQSANALILKRMKRRYDPELLYNCVPAAHRKISGLVGIQTETEKQFEDTLQAVDDLVISYPHVFPYSARGGTPAEKIPKQIPKLIQKERASLVRAAGNRVFKDVLTQLVGYTGRALIERSAANSRDFKHGRLDNYLPIRFIDQENTVGELVEAEVIGASSNTLIACRHVQE